MSLSSKFTRCFSKQVMESYYSCNQGYAPWNPTPYQPHDLGYDAYQSNGFGDAYYGYEDPSPPYPPSQKGIEELIKLLCQERKEIQEIQKQIANQVNTLCSIAIQLMTQSAINNSSSTSQPLNSEDRPSKSLPNPRGCIPTLSQCKGRKGTLSQPRSNQWRSIHTLYIHQERKKDSRLSQPLSNQWRSIPTLFRCTNQKEREDALLHEENFESLEQEGIHECLEEVEEENEYQEAEDIDKEVEDKDKGQKGIEIVHFTSSEATPPKLPSELHFKWANPYDMNCLSPQSYGLFKTDGQLKALCGVLDKKKMDFMELSESKFKEYNGLLHKLHNNKAKIGWAN
ncbi:hypothetical protein PIB30_050236 [Stylosanthes scabra]|uniref:Uncharacterized protein n=1 Tax=Stylosanthes scabra TaxID=79078 RepID=A0ABU6QIB4_9FABA|nr:hypothetical protein [Stylosanthes scabra]